MKSYYREHLRIWNSTPLFSLFSQTTGSVASLLCIRRCPSWGKSGNYGSFLASKLLSLQHCTVWGIQFRVTAEIGKKCSFSVGLCLTIVVSYSNVNLQKTHWSKGCLPVSLYGVREFNFHYKFRFSASFFLFFFLFDQEDLWQFSTTIPLLLPINFK